jgi:CheY-like chemotaxis protein
MDRELRILLLDNQNTDADMMEHELHKGGILFTSRCVQTKEDFLRELKVFSPDFILSDYKLPFFDGSSALAIAREYCPDVSFIFVPGAAIWEKLTNETLKGAATDCFIEIK